MRAVVLAATLLLSAQVFAYADLPRSGLGGYARLLARPDLSGGDGKLGFWNLYGRLLNEGPWISLEPRTTVLRQPGGAWAELHLKVEGPGPIGADASSGSLAAMRLSDAYLRAGPRRAPPGRHGACWGPQDYDHREVRRAVDEAAKKRALDVYAEGGKSWVFYQLNVTT